MGVDELGGKDLRPVKELLEIITAAVWDHFDASSKPLAGIELNAEDWELLGILCDYGGEGKLLDLPVTVASLPTGEFRLIHQEAR